MKAATSVNEVAAIDGEERGQTAVFAGYLQMEWNVPFEDDYRTGC